MNFPLISDNNKIKKLNTPLMAVSLSLSQAKLGATSLHFPLHCRLVSTFSNLSSSSSVAHFPLIHIYNPLIFCTSQTLEQQRISHSELLSSSLASIMSSHVKDGKHTDTLLLMLKVAFASNFISLSLDLSTDLFYSDVQLKE